MLHHVPLVGAVFLPPAAVAIAEGETALALATGLPAIAVSGSWVARRGAAEDTDVRGIEAAAVFVGLFLLVSLLAIPGFRVLGMGWVDAAFESVSAFTSTGLSVAGDTFGWPLSGHVLRGWLQWSGGFAIALAGVALLLNPGQAGGQVGVFDMTDRDIVLSVRAQARSLLVVYAALTGIGVALLIPLMPTWWEGLVVALTAVSTGGMTPRADSLASYSVAAQTATMLLCLSTTVSLVAYVVARRAGLRAALARSNAGPVLALAAGGLAAALAVTLLVEGWRPALLIDVALNTLSGFTTAGFSVAELTSVPALLAVLVALMAIGGGIGSTAGGVKVDRVVLMARMVGLTILRLRTPHSAVTSLREPKGSVDIDRIISVVAIAFLYAATAAIAWLVFLLAGAPALGSLFDIVSALSTVGLSVGVDADLADGLKWVLIAAMLLGRLEFVALLAVLSPSVWIRNGG